MTLGDGRRWPACRLARGSCAAGAPPAGGGAPRVRRWPVPKSLYRQGAPGEDIGPRSIESRRVGEMTSRSQRSQR
ncbi:DUF6009 family protein [Streptomyces sp. YS-3]|uniref:DUF6009 family protein n=1 Tax=Streptomyces sp. YS-3 TaxID=3381352 RepID=UPI003862A205